SIGAPRASYADVTTAAAGRSLATLRDPRNQAAARVDAAVPGDRPVDRRREQHRAARRRMAPALRTAANAARGPRPLVSRLRPCPAGVRRERGLCPIARVLDE